MKGKKRHHRLSGLIVLSIFDFQFSILFSFPFGRAGAGCLNAMPVECVGKATQRVSGNDTLFFFRDEIQLHSLVGEADWYATATGAVVQTAAEDFYPEDGGYFLVKDGVEYSPFYVFRLRQADIAMTAEQNCDNTVLYLTGDVTPYTYTRRNGTRGTYARACSLDYNALAWNNEQWVDSAVTEHPKLAATVILPFALYGKTDLKLCYDDGLRDTLEAEPACVTLPVAPEDIKAVKMELVTLGTAKENDPLGNNELERLVEQKIEDGKSYSGALEVAFYSNPTPAAQFYQWNVYKSTERIATRSDRDIRYTFSEPGSYRVVCKVNNQYCTSDSAEQVINISESYLRVPNVFTPNGDGINDEFRVAYRSLREFHCWVYNRWGHLVYEWTDPAKGWDGTINGRPAAEGAYFYVIRALGTDAAKNASYIGLKAAYKKKKLNADDSVIGVYQLSGDINLIRGKK